MRTVFSAEVFSPSFAGLFRRSSGNVRPKSDFFSILFA